VIHQQRRNSISEKYLVNPSNLAKTEKAHENIMPEQEMNPVQMPHPSKARQCSKSPLPGHSAQSNGGMPGRGYVEVSI